MFTSTCRVLLQCDCEQVKVLMRIDYTAVVLSDAVPQRSVAVGEFISVSSQRDSE